MKECVNNFHSAKQLYGDYTLEINCKIKLFFTALKTICELRIKIIQLKGHINQSY